MPTLTESIAFQEASPLTQENMTFYYNKSFSLHTWTANLEEASAALSPVFGELFGEGQGEINVSSTKLMVWLRVSVSETHPNQTVHGNGNGQSHLLEHFCIVLTLFLI